MYLRNIFNLPSVNVLFLFLSAIFFARFFNLDFKLLYLLFIVLFLLIFSLVFFIFNKNIVADIAFYIAVFSMFFSYYEYRNTYNSLHLRFFNDKFATAYYGEVVSYPVLRSLESKFVNCKKINLKDNIFRQEYYMDVFAVKDYGGRFYFREGRIFVKSLNVLKNLRLGDFLLVDASFYLLENNCGDFDYATYLRDSGVDFLSFPGKDSEFTFLGVNNVSFIFAFAESIRNYFIFVYDKFLDDRYFNFIRAFIFGDKQFLSYEVLDSFKKIGIMHILAVSGLHVGFISFIFFLCFFYVFRFDRKFSLIFSLFFAFIYFFILDYSESVFRSCLMFLFYVIVYVLDRDRNLINIICLAALCVLFFNPNSLFLISFQLSFLATLGIIIFISPIRNFLISKFGFLFNFLDNFSYRFVYFFKKIIFKLIDVFAVSLSAQILTIPILIYNFNGFSLIGIFVNVFLFFIVFLIICFALFLLPVSFFNSFAFYFAFILEFLIEILFNFVDFFAIFSYAYIVIDFSFVIFYLLLLSFIIFYYSKF